MTRLSVNINKIATLRNARGGNIPDLLKAAKAIQEYGAQGITVHPRPDERHIRNKDVYDLKPLITTEFNIEGFPGEAFVSLVLEVRPDQVTFVPDSPDVLTSNAGWDTIQNMSFLQEVIARCKEAGIRTSVFIEPDLSMIENAVKTGTDRIELYTERYAKIYASDPHSAIAPFEKAAALANKLGLGVNAGHDLNLENLEFFIRKIPCVKEVSIGHALISDALYFGLKETIKKYITALQNASA